MKLLLFPFDTEEFGWLGQSVGGMKGENKEMSLLNTGREVKTDFYFVFVHTDVRCLTFTSFIYFSLCSSTGNLFYLLISVWVDKPDN